MKNSQFFIKKYPEVYSCLIFITSVSRKSKKMNVVFCRYCQIFLWSMVLKYKMYSWFLKLWIFHCNGSVPCGTLIMIRNKNIFYLNVYSHGIFFQTKDLMMSNTGRRSWMINWMEYLWKLTIFIVYTNKRVWTIPLLYVYWPL
jgi:hypothetical protein